jgi:hypothetical protein
MHILISFRLIFAARADRAYCRPCINHENTAYNYLSATGVFTPYARL